MSNKHGWRKTKFPERHVKCPCGVWFKTQDPSKVFHTSACRVKVWHRNNKDKLAVSQKKYRDRMKIEGKVQP